jgi:hypothetical protein
MGKGLDCGSYRKEASVAKMVSKYGKAGNSQLMQELISIAWSLGFIPSVWEATVGV